MRLNVKTVRPAAWGLSIYFSLMALDSFDLSINSSLLRFVVLLPVLLSLFQLSDSHLYFHPLIVLHGLFLCLALLSLYYTISLPNTIRSDTTLALNTLLIVLMGVVIDFNASEIRLLEYALVLGGWIMVIMLLLFSDYSNGRLTIKMGEVAQNQNYIYGYLTFSMLFHLLRYYDRRSLIHLLAAIAIVIVTFLTGSRGSILSIAAVMILVSFHAVMQSKNKARNLMLFSVLVVGLFAMSRILLVLMPPEVAVRFSLDYIEEKGTTGRLSTWKALWDQFYHAPVLRELFGYGYGTTRLLNTYNGNVAHNLYLDNLISLGLLGAGLQIIIQLCSMVTLFKERRMTAFYTYFSLVFMCFSLSLTSYKPIWNMMIMALIYTKNQALSDSREGAYML